MLYGENERLKRAEGGRVLVWVCARVFTAAAMAKGQRRFQGSRGNGFQQWLPTLLIVCFYRQFQIEN